MSERPDPDRRFAVPKVPVWARIIGWFRRQWLALEAWRDARVAYRTEVFKCSIIGRTHWTDLKRIEPTHRWDLFEAPNGKRHYEFHAMHVLSHEKQHNAFIVTVLPWLHGNKRLDYAAWQKVVREHLRYEKAPQE